MSKIKYDRSLTPTENFQALLVASGYPSDFAAEMEVIKVTPPETETEKAKLDVMFGPKAEEYYKIRQRTHTYTPVGNLPKAALDVKYEFEVNNEKDSSNIGMKLKQQMVDAGFINQDALVLIDDSVFDLLGSDNVARIELGKNDVLTIGDESVKFSNYIANDKLEPNPNYFLVLNPYTDRQDNGVIEVKEIKDKFGSSCYFASALYEGEPRDPLQKYSELSSVLGYGELAWTERAGLDVKDMAANDEVRLTKGDVVDNATLFSEGANSVVVNKMTWELTEKATAEQKNTYRGVGRSQFAVLPIRVFFHNSKFDKVIDENWVSTNTSDTDELLSFELKNDVAEFFVNQTDEEILDQLHLPIRGHFGMMVITPIVGETVTENWGKVTRTENVAKVVVSSKDIINNFYEFSGELKLEFVLELKPAPQPGMPSEELNGFDKE